VGEVLGEAPQEPLEGGTPPDLFRRTKGAFRSRSRVNPQWGQGKTLSFSVKSRLTPPHAPEAFTRGRRYRLAPPKPVLPRFPNTHSKHPLSPEREAS